MDWLYSLLDNSSVPVVTALILGILTAISPCPLATNLTAVAYLGRELDNRRKILIKGLLYARRSYYIYYPQGRGCLWHSGCNKHHRRMDYWASPYSHRPVYVVRSSAPLAKIRLFGR